MAIGIAAIGVSGRPGHATVVADQIDATEIAAHLKARLVGDKSPETVQFMDSLPRVANGKVKNKALLVERQNEIARMVI